MFSPHVSSPILPEISNNVCCLVPLYIVLGTSCWMIESLHPNSNIIDSAFGLKQKFSAFSDMGEKRYSGSVGHMKSMIHSSSWTSDHKYSDYNSAAQSSSNHAPPSPPAAGRRSRPSFLDSIQISKGRSSSPPLFGTEKADSSSSKVYPVDGLGSSVSQRSANTSVASGDGVGLFNHIMENKHDFFSQKQNEDFAALEQVYLLHFFSCNIFKYFF